MKLSRRGLIGGLVALAAPAIIRTPGLLMPVSPFKRSEIWFDHPGIYDAVTIQDTADIITVHLSDEWKAEHGVVQTVAYQHGVVYQKNAAGVWYTNDKHAKHKTLDLRNAYTF